MAKIRFASYTVRRRRQDGSYEIMLHMGGDYPFPTEQHEIAKTGDVVTAFGNYVERAKATGKPIMASVIHISGRKPPGLDKIPDVFLNAEPGLNDDGL